MPEVGELDKRKELLSVGNSQLPGASRAIVSDPSSLNPTRRRLDRRAVDSHGWQVYCTCHWW